MGNFVSKHPYLTFFLGLFAISGVVAVVGDTTGAIKVAGVPRRNPLPPKAVS